MKQTKTYTASFHNGGRAKDSKDTKSRGKAKKSQACREHNIRDPKYVSKQKHIDSNGIHEIWHDETWQDAYERIFGEAFAEYNSKRRADRRTRSYLDEIKNSDQKIPVYEAIIAIGNKDCLPDDTEAVKEVYKDFIAEWKKQNPNMEIIGVYYHADEDGAPHLHIDYIPVARNLTRGMSVQNSLTKALEQQGIKSIELDPKVILRKYGIYLHEKESKNTERQAQYDDFMQNRVDGNGKAVKTRLLTAQIQWEHKMRNLLIKIARKHGLRIENPNEHRAHFDTPEFKELKSGELQKITMTQIEELYFELEDLKQEQDEQGEYAARLSQKESELRDVQIQQESREAQQNERERRLDEKTRIVETAEEMKALADMEREEARALNDTYFEHHKEAVEEVKQELAYDIADAKKQLEEAQRKNSEASEKLGNAAAELQAAQSLREQNEKERASLSAERESLRESVKKQVEDELAEKSEALERREKRLSRWMGIFHKLKTKLRRKEKTVSARESTVALREASADNRESDFDRKLQELNKNVNKVNAYRDQAVAFYQDAPKGMARFSQEINLQEGLAASKTNSPQRLMSWFKSVERKFASWIYAAQYTVKQFFSKSPDEMQRIVDSMRRNNSADFGSFVDMRMRGKTAEQIERKEKLKAQEKSFGIGM